MLNASDFASQGPGFKSYCRQNSAHDCMALHDTDPFISILPLFLNDLNNVEKDKKKNTKSLSCLKKTISGATVKSSGVQIFLG